MRLEFDAEEAREVFLLIVGRLLDETGLEATDRAALLRWHTNEMRAGSPGMRDLTAKVNADIGRALKTKSRSAVMKPDWK